jgi:ribosomal protein S18 acetylase RimI-like enzyme
MVEVRLFKLSDQHFLVEMLYEAVYWRLNPDKPSFDIAVQDINFTQAASHMNELPGDIAVVAQQDGKLAGAAWVRKWESNAVRGFISPNIPVLIMAVHSSCRREGVGKKLIEALITEAEQQNIEAVSLMVSKDNHALLLYEQCGFQPYEDCGDSLLPLRELKR